MDVILFNKPFGVVSQFTIPGSRRGPSAATPPPTLHDYLPQRDIYPAGRLDAASEGLLVLTADGALQHRLSDPRHKLIKTYYVQVEGEPTPDALANLARSVRIGDFNTQPARVRVVPEPGWLWTRNPPIRSRRAIPTSWLEIRMSEGKNRQVRRMTAAVGCPTLRLIRYGVGVWTLAGLGPGDWRTAPASR
jgi:23S rRNA pseudouridine2457 synthase